MATAEPPPEPALADRRLREMSSADLLPFVDDVAVHLELRGMLERGGHAIGHDPSACVVWHPEHALLIAHGDAPRAAVVEILARHPAAAALLVGEGRLGRLRAAVPDWEPVQLMRLVSPRRLPRQDGDAPTADWLAERHACAVEALPPVERAEVERASLAGRLAVSLAGRRIASWCFAGWETALHCDVTVRTLPDHRRRGHAGACCRLWITETLRLGRRVQWISEVDNDASVQLARSLGFESLETVTVLRRP
jgi:RimJ/RimL family protein N-acetyltransferase